MSYKVGSAVALDNNLHGTIKYIGRMRGRKGLWYGIKLTSADGDSDGMHGGRYYFYCKQNRGIFVKKNQIKHSISNTKAAKHYQKMSILRQSKISLFDVSIPHNSEDHHNSNEHKMDYESSLIHQFFRFSLSTLIKYLDNNTLHNLFSIKHFAEFYDISSFWSYNMLIERIIIKGDSTIYRQLQLNGIYVQVWNVDEALCTLKNNPIIKDNKWKVEKYRFLVFIAMQHIKSHGGMYAFSPVRWPSQRVSIKRKISKANCKKLRDAFVKIYGDLRVVSSDLISINGSRQTHNGSAKKFKQFEAMFAANRKLSMFRNRSNMNNILTKLRRVLLVSITDLMVRRWILINTSSHTVICGWISSKCVVVIFGGCRSSYSYW